MGECDSIESLQNKQICNYSCIKAKGVLQNMVWLSCVINVKYRSISTSEQVIQIVSFTAAWLCVMKDKRRSEIICERYSGY